MPVFPIKFAINFLPNGRQHYYQHDHQIQRRKTNSLNLNRKLKKNEKNLKRWVFPYWNFNMMSILHVDSPTLHWGHYITIILKNEILVISWEDLHTLPTPISFVFSVLGLSRKAPMCFWYQFKSQIIVLSKRKQN